MSSMNFNACHHRWQNRREAEVLASSAWPCYVQLRLSLTCWEVQSTVETVPMKAFSFTPHFSMFSPLLPSLDMLVTYGPAVVQPATEATKNRATANFFISSPYFT